MQTFVTQAELARSVNRSKSGMEKTLRRLGILPDAVAVDVQCGEASMHLYHVGNIQSIRRAILGPAANTVL